MANQVTTWRCSVCGYIHEGDAPPENCPVCGVPASEFEEMVKPEAATPATASTGSANAWRCAVCGYIHEGDAPPDACPVCGAPASEFEAHETTDAPPASSASAAGRILIIGGGIAGLSAAEAAREVSKEAQITLVSAEAEPPYYRLNLTRYLAGEISDSELPVHPPEWFASRQIDLQLGKQLERMDPDAHRVVFTDGSSMEYDKLIIATGATPFMPPLPGSDLPHVFTLRTRDDAQAILKAAGEAKQIVCIGGGILGLETAGALVRTGAGVTILEAFDHLMPRQLNATGGEVLARHLYQLGIDVLTQARTAAIEASRVELTDGSTLPADLVVITVGVRSNIQALADSGLPVNKGVLVDNFMRTSHPDILAAGDVCEHDGILYGSWAAAQFQGSIAGMNAAGKSTEFGGIPRSHMLKVLGKDMFSIGLITSTDGSYTTLDEQTGSAYRLFTLRDGMLAGALLLGDLALMPDIRKAVESKQKIGSPASVKGVVDAITAR